MSVAELAAMAVVVAVVVVAMVVAQARWNPPLLLPCLL